MFGMGIGEILLIAIVAVLFLGPDKLPETMVSIAKFFRSVKGTVNTARATIEEEMKFSEMKQEALSYKNDLLNASSELERLTDLKEIGSEIASVKQELTFETPISVPMAPKEPEAVTFIPKPKPINPPEENV
jgi:sec-independent protein translocase protein TatB